MEAKLYVGNMSYDTTEDELRAMFAEAGSVESVDIIKDRNTGAPKGFGFIVMSNQEEAEKAISLFNGKEVNGRQLTVNPAKPREERPGGRRPFNKSGNRGGGGGGGRGGQNRRY